MSEIFPSESCQVNECSQSMSQIPQAKPQEALQPKQAQCNSVIGESMKGNTHINSEISQNQVYLQQSIEFAPIAIAIFDQQMRYLACSRKWLEEYHLKDDIIGRCHYEIFTDISPEWQQIHQRCLAGAIEQCDEDPFPRANGSLNWVSWSIHPWYEASGEIGGITIFSENITQRKQTETAIQHNQDRYRSLVSAISQVVWVVPGDGNVIHDNPSWREFTGQTFEEFVGWGWLDVIHPDDRQLALETWETAVKTGNAYEVEYRLRRYDGEYRYMLMRGVPVLEADGSIREWIGICNDIHESKEAEFALRENNALLRSILENTPDFIVVKDCQGRHVALNSNLANFMGKSIQEIIGKDDTELLPLDTAREIMAKDQEVITTGKKLTYEEGFFDGEIYQTFLTAKVPWQDNHGNILGIIGTTRNISDRKQAELALKQSEERLRSLIEATSQIVWSTNAEGGFVTDQPQWRAFTGQTVAEIQGWGWLNKVHPEDQQYTSETWLAALANHTVYEAKTRIQRYDGEYRYMSVRGVPILATDGSICEWIGTHTDITEREEAEQELRRTLEILDSASDSIIIRDMDDRIMYWNRGAELLYGWAKEEVIGQYIHQFLQTVFPKSLEIVLSEFLEQGNWEGELHHTTRDGRHIIVASRWTLQRDAQGQTYTQLEINTDISDRKQAELALAQAKEAAEAANRTKSEFLANMNHELRTPLNGILGYAQILQRDPATTPKQQKGLSVIYQCGYHLLTLINDILDLSKLEVQKMDLYPQDFHFANFLTTTVEICRIKAEQKGIAFNHQTINLPTAVHADDKRLRQVLLNLLGNAVKFTDFGSVTFTVEAVGNEQTAHTPTTRIRFQIKDTGIGIPRDKWQSIFLPFEQAGKRDRNSEGTGLGLAISQQIVQMMGSSIQVESTPNQGSCFWFEVELPPADWLSQPTSNNRKVIGYQGNPRKILVIDDRSENRAVVVGMLAPLGFKLAQADDGQTGLDLALQMRPDLIITDVMMSTMNGLEMTRRLRQLPDFALTPIIASPASLSQVDMQEALDAGCSSFFPKPLEFNGLLGELQRHLELHWIYDTPPADPVCSEVASTPQLVVPSPQELTTIYRAAQDGFMSDIQQEANRLKQLNSQYVPFANKLLELSQKFDDEAILNLLKPHI
ncbi:multi-sensor hybrid histidine kinase [Nostoc sp. NIES-2111]|nr:multi-sensor hybrid histidine kinase [Nostoc sp. NIES-2111]